MSWDRPRRRDGRVVAALHPRTLADKVWDDHLAQPPAEAGTGTPDQLVVDRILLHEHQVGLIGRSNHDGTRIADPRRIVACADQQGPTTPSGDEPRSGAQLVASVERLERTSASLGLPVFGPGDPRAGVVNVVAAEQGMVLPGDLIVGADAHVATNGAFGALALVISDAEVVEVVRTGQVSRVRPSTVRASVAGKLTAGASAKDVALWLLGRLGPGMADGKVLELVGPVVTDLGVEGRMTLTNVAVESGADAVVIAPDLAVERYLSGRPFSPKGAAWAGAVAGWRGLGGDPGADYDADVVAFGGLISPQVTWGTHADQVVALDGVVPSPDASDPGRRARHEQALAHHGLVPGEPVSAIEIDQVFIGSCANARLDDLRAAAEVVRGGRVQVPSWVVPGSWPVRHQAEAEGLHRVFLDAGFEWREPGCSLCIGANGDAVRPGSRLASTANRPVRGLVGPSARVHLLSPASAAASALVGRLAAHSTTR